MDKLFQAFIEGVNPTMAVNGLGALNLKKYTGQGTKVALQAGDLQPTQRYEAFKNQFSGLAEVADEDMKATQRKANEDDAK